MSTTGETARGRRRRPWGTQNKVKAIETSARVSVESDTTSNSSSRIESVVSEAVTESTSTQLSPEQQEFLAGDGSGSEMSEYDELERVSRKQSCVNTEKSECLQGDKSNSSAQVGNCSKIEKPCVAKPANTKKGNMSAKKRAIANIKRKRRAADESRMKQLAVEVDVEPESPKLDDLSPGSEFDVSMLDNMMSLRRTVVNESCNSSVVNTQDVSLDGMDTSGLNEDFTFARYVAGLFENITESRDNAKSDSSDTGNLEKLVSASQAATCSTLKRKTEPVSITVPNEVTAKKSKSCGDVSIRLDVLNDTKSVTNTVFDDTDLLDYDEDVEDDDAVDGNGVDEFCFNPDENYTELDFPSGETKRVKSSPVNKKSLSDTLLRKPASNQQQTAGSKTSLPAIKFKGFQKLNFAPSLIKKTELKPVDNKKSSGEVEGVKEVKMPTREVVKVTTDKQGEKNVVLSEPKKTELKHADNKRPSGEVEGVKEVKRPTGEVVKITAEKQGEKSIVLSEPKKVVDCSKKLQQNRLQEKTVQNALKGNEAVKVQTACSVQRQQKQDVGNKSVLQVAEVKEGVEKVKTTDKAGDLLSKINSCLSSSSDTSDDLCELWKTCCRSRDIAGIAKMRTLLCEGSLRQCHKDVLHQSICLLANEVSSNPCKWEELGCAALDLTHCALQCGLYLPLTSTNCRVLVMHSWLARQEMRLVLCAYFNTLAHTVKSQSDEADKDFGKVIIRFARQTSNMEDFIKRELDENKRSNDIGSAVEVLEKVISEDLEAGLFVCVRKGLNAVELESCRMSQILSVLPADIQLDQIIDCSQAVVIQSTVKSDLHDTSASKIESKVLSVDETNNLSPVKTNLNKSNKSHSGSGADKNLVSRPSSISPRAGHSGHRPPDKDSVRDNKRDTKRPINGQKHSVGRMKHGSDRWSVESYAPDPNKSESRRSPYVRSGNVVPSLLNLPFISPDVTSWVALSSRFTRETDLSRGSTNLLRSHSAVDRPTGFKSHAGDWSRRKSSNDDHSWRVQNAAPQHERRTSKIFQSQGERRTNENFQSQGGRRAEYVQSHDSHRTDQRSSRDRQSYLLPTPVLDEGRRRREYQDTSRLGGDGRSPVRQPSQLYGRPAACGGPAALGGPALHGGPVLHGRAAALGRPAARGGPALHGRPAALGGPALHGEPALHGGPASIPQASGGSQLPAEVAQTLLNDIQLRLMHHVRFGNITECYNRDAMAQNLLLHFCDNPLMWENRNLDRLRDIVLMLVDHYVESQKPSVRFQSGQR